jgi:hypothetical protein
MLNLNRIFYCEEFFVKNIMVERIATNRYILNILI